MSKSAEVDVAAYNELKRIAGFHMRGERSDHTLSPTALVNEAYLKFQAAKNACTQIEFKAVASRNMRQILVNHALARKALKRGGEDSTILVPEDALGNPDVGVDLLGLNEALERLEVIDEVKAQIVDLRYFAGCTNDEIAETLGISVATVKRKWTSAKAWLYREMSKT